MLKIKESERASLDDIINSNWVTMNGTEKMNPNVHHCNSGCGSAGLGNIKRLMFSKKLNKGKSSAMNKIEEIPYM